MIKMIHFFSARIKKEIPWEIPFCQCWLHLWGKLHRAL